jgi:hypothetical protein
MLPAKLGHAPTTHWLELKVSVNGAFTAKHAVVAEAIVDHWLTLAGPQLSFT